MELRLITQRKYKSALIRVIVMNNNSKDLIERNMEGLEKRQEWFADAVRATFYMPFDSDILPKQVKASICISF